MLKIIKANKTIAYMDIKDARVIKSKDAEFTVSFKCACKALKSEYLMDKDCEVELDGNRYKISRLEIIKQKGAITSFSVFAEHKSYILIEKTHDKYSVTGTVQAHMSQILSGTDFSFLGTDISDSKDITVEYTNSRYLINRVAREFGGTLIFKGAQIGVYKSLGEDLPLALTVSHNLKSITRSQDFSTNQVSYRVDVDTLSMQDYETISINDTVRVVYSELGLDDRLKVMRTEYDPVRKKNISIEVGDIQDDTFLDDLLDLVDENVELAENVITEVVHMQVINVETAHILNAWIKNLFVEYIETNFDALVKGNPISVRNYVLIINEEVSFITDELSLIEFEPLFIPDPNGSGRKINVYYTAIGDHPDAYRYFTITDPRLIHSGLTDKEADAFKVLVKKTLKRHIKSVQKFEEITLSSGVKTVMPIVWWGEGTDSDGTTKGKSKSFKDDIGITDIQYLQNNSGFLGRRMNSLTANYEYIDPKTGKWVPEIFGYGGSTGNVIFHKDKVALTNADLSDSNALHIGYSSTGAKIVGENSTIFLDGIVKLGVERVTKAQPIDPLGKNVYNRGVWNGDYMIVDRPSVGGVNYNRHTETSNAISIELSANGGSAMVLNLSSYVLKDNDRYVDITISKSLYGISAYAYGWYLELGYFLQYPYPSPTNPSIDKTKYPYELVPTWSVISDNGIDITLRCDLLKHSKSQWVGKVLGVSCGSENRTVSGYLCVIKVIEEQQIIQ